MALNMGRARKRLLWLLNSEMWHRRPLALMYRVALWEIFRLIETPRIENIGGDVLTILYPLEGYSRVIYYFHFNKPFIARFYEWFFEEGMVYIDCGANIGLYSITVAKKVGREGAVYSFEPQPSIFHRLLANIHLNGLDNVYAYNVALGDRVEKVELVQLHDHVASYVRPLQQQPTLNTTCASTTLDAFFTNHPLQRADLLKIDVEGFEYRVLCGAKETIARLRPSLIQFEYYPDYSFLPREEWPTLALYRSFFTELGYEGFFCVGRRSGRLEPLLEEGPQDNDIFCIERGMRGAMRTKLFA